MMKNTLTSLLLLGVVLYGLLGCQRVDPELVSGDTHALKTVPSDRFFLLDTTEWTYLSHMGNFYNFMRSGQSVELPGKGDFVIYQDNQIAFFGQLISLDISSDQTGMELAETAVNSLFDFFALRDTLLTLGNGYQVEYDSLATLSNDTLKLSSVKRSIRDGNFLRGIIDFQNFSLVDLSVGEQFFYLTPEWDNGVLTRDAMLRWDQDLQLDGTLLLTQFDQNEFGDSLMLRRRIWNNNLNGFPVDFVVEEWMIIKWQIPGSESIELNFSVDGETDYAARYRENGAWIQTADASFGEAPATLTGWNRLDNAWLQLSHKTIIKPIFCGREGLSITKRIQLDFVMETEWPQWQMTANLTQLDQFISEFGLFSDMASYSLDNEVYTSEIANLQGELDNETPTAAFTISPPTGYTNTSFKMNAGSSSDVEDKMNQLQVRWDFEYDGTWDTDYSTTKLVTHQYISAGLYNVRLQVLDTQGATDELVKELTVYETSSAPIAAFTVSPESGKQSELFTFDASACYDAEDALSLLQVRWDFQNDGIWDTPFSSAKAQAWIFGSPGDFVVKLEVKDTDGLTGSTTKLVRVTEGNVKPEAFFTVDPESGSTETRFDFDASGSTDIEDPSEDLLVRWDFENDGVWDTEKRTLKTVTHQFLSAGNYTVVLEVEDTEGFTNTFTRTIMVSNPNTPPEADFSITPATGDINTKFLFDASISTDQEDSLDVLEVRWDWNNDDIWDTEFSTVKTISRQFSNAGTKIIKVEVRDSGGLTDIRAKLLIVN